MPNITRRDFLDGMALTIAADLAPESLFAQGAPGDPGPARLGGIRGSHDGAFEAAHWLALDGEAVDARGLDVEERYDLVVVGAGLSGLAAALLWRQRMGTRASILVLDNHADFGGHATRNEFALDGRIFLSYGGSESLQAPSTFSGDVRRLLRRVGLRVERFETHFHRTLYPDLGLSRSIFFDRETFGQDRLVAGDPSVFVADDIPPGRTNARSAAAFVADFPLDEASNDKLAALIGGTRDPLATMPKAAAETYLARVSYPRFLEEQWGLSEKAVAVFRQRTSDYFGAATAYVSAGEAMAAGLPGRAAPAASKKERAALEEPYIHHFPDGNAGVARMFVRALVKGVAPGETMEDIVLAPFDYAKLDVVGAPSRVRLSSTVLRLANTPRGVDVTYARAGKLHRLSARNVVWAGWGMMLPHVMPELGQPQKTALSQGVKQPLVYAKALIRDWTSFARLGVHEIHAPGGQHCRVKLDYPVSMSGYRFPTRPEEPMVVHMVHVPEPDAKLPSMRERARAARAMLLGKPFAEYETAVREELSRMLGPGGFDAGRDIAAITVNRWSHGYAYTPNDLDDEETAAERTARLSRRRVGRVAVAGSDAGWDAYAHVAIDEAHRAVRDLLG